MRAFRERAFRERAFRERAFRERAFRERASEHDETSEVRLAIRKLAQGGRTGPRDLPG